MKPKLAIIVPCYNEEEILNYSAKKLLASLNFLKKQKLIEQTSFLLLVDDGSKDKTWNIINGLSNKNISISGIKLSRNFGHQNALLAGLHTVHKNTDCTITIDADLQDDINILKDMILAFNEGNQIVYGVRKERKTDNLLKRVPTLIFYKLMNLLGVESVYNHADYRLASREAIENLFKFKEVNLYLRGIFPLIGFKTTKVYYNRLKRIGGDPKYTFKTLLALAWNGITSLSVVPLRIVTRIGFIIFIISVFLSFYSLYSYFFKERVPGWASITLPIYFMGGIQLLCLGILGEYIGKIYNETKHRPRFIIEDKS